MPWWAWAAMIGVQAAVLVGVYLLGRRVLRSRMRQRPAGPMVIDAGGAACVPVLATFAGLCGLSPWIALAVNSLNPHLRFGAGGIDYRVLRRRFMPYGAISSVDVRTAPGTVNLCFAFDCALVTFAANLGDETLAREALRRLPDAVPLTPRARALRDRAG